MSFEPRFSLASSLLSETGTDLWKVHSDVLERQAQGEDILMMSVGDPDLRTIVRVVEHAVTSLYRGRTHYSPGMGNYICERQ